MVLRIIIIVFKKKARGAFIGPYFIFFLKYFYKPFNNMVVYQFMIKEISSQAHDACNGESIR